RGSTSSRTAASAGWPQLGMHVIFQLEPGFLCAVRHSPGPARYQPDPKSHDVVSRDRGILLIKGYVGSLQIYRLRSGKTRSGRRARPRTELNFHVALSPEVARMGVIFRVLGPQQVAPISLAPE